MSAKVEKNNRKGIMFTNIFLTFASEMQCRNYKIDIISNKLWI